MDIRAKSAKFYDLQPFPEDIPFYQALIPSPTARILELGCGTGRVLMSLYKHCAYYHGIDKSKAMLAICLENMRSATISKEKACVEIADITDFELDGCFDFIIAPYRVFQNLETDEQVDGLFRCVKKHMSPGGSCILNMFNPKWGPNDFAQQWKRMDERFCWERIVEGRKITCHDRRAFIDEEKLITYPELFYRQYKDTKLEDELVLKIVMRVYYPEQLEKLITSHGFEIWQRWGGYQGEQYGEGPDLIIQFGTGG